MNFIKSTLAAVKVAGFAAAISAIAATTASAQSTLRGASLFDENHAYTQTLMKFAELVNEYSGEEITFDLRLNSELGTEPDYVNFLTQGVAIDFAIIAPSNLARFADSLPLMDMPFLFSVTSITGMLCCPATSSTRLWTNCARKPTLSSLAMLAAERAT